MRIFSPLYDRVLRWAGHPHAEGYLVALSFAESSFFPIPPDVMLAPMTLARPARGWRLGSVQDAITTDAPWLVKGDWAQRDDRGRPHPCSHHR